MPHAGLLLPVVLFLQAQLTLQAEAPDAAQVLLDFANDARGANKQALSSWRDGTDPCTWTGVACTGTAVTSIRLERAGLQGSLTPALAQLTSLQHINLSGNKLRGQLPPRWARLTRLERLHLDNNALSGMLPAAWNMLDSLQYLTLSGNQFNGSLPTAWSSMGRLFLLDLAGNRLSGTLPAPWARQRTLVRLSLARNALLGGLPREWSLLRSLLQLDLAGNELRGVLPSEWSALQQVTSLDLSSNALDGGLPAEWGRLSSLQVLEVQGNQLTGAIPTAWTALADRAYRIGLAENAQLCGAVPPPLSRAVLIAGSSKEGSGLTAPCSWETDAAALLAFKADVTAQTAQAVLQDWLPQANPCAAAVWSGVSCKGGRVHSLNLTNAGLKVSSLEHLASLDQLVEVLLSGNSAAGASLPASWARLEQLALADLSGMGLAGSLPPLWAQMSGLKQLLLSGNDLNGTLPAGWAALTNLASLTLAKNALTGSLPPEWGALTSLSTLDASANYLSGALAEGWAGMAALKELRLDSNNLAGPIPASWATLPSLSRLGLSSNLGVCGGQPVWREGTTLHAEATNVQQNCLMVNTSATMAAVVLGVALSLTLLSLAAVGGMFVLLRRQRAEMQLLQIEHSSLSFPSMSIGGGGGKQANPHTFCLSVDARQAAPAADRFKSLTVTNPWEGEHAGYIQVPLATPHGGLPPPPSIGGVSTTPRSAPPQEQEHRSPSPGSGMPSPERHLWQVAAQAADRGVDLTARRARLRRAQLFRSRSEAPSALTEASASEEVDEQGQREQEGPAWSQDDSELDMMRVHSRLALLPSDGGMV